MKDSYISGATLSIEPSEVPPYNVNTFTEKISGTEFFSVVAANLNEAGYNLTAEQIKASTSITNNEKSNKIYISVEMQDPQKSADVANALIDNFPAYITALVREKSEDDLKEIELYYTESEIQLDEKFDELTGYRNEHAGIANIQKEIEVLEKQQVNLIVLENNTNINIDIYSMQLANLLDIAKVKGIEIATDIPIDGSEVSGTKESVDLNEISAISNSELDKEITRIQIDILEEQSRIIAISDSISVINNQIAEKESLYNEFGYKYEMVVAAYDNAKETCMQYLSQMASLQEMTFSRLGEENITTEKRAVVPESPVETNRLRTIAVFGVVGLILGGIIVLFRAYWIKEKDKLKE